MAKTKAAVPAEQIANAILVVRGHRVMLDADLAGLYGVETRALVQALKRNAERFPEDFCFQLEAEELEVLRSQTVISIPRRGGGRTAPYVFTEQGVAMLFSSEASASSLNGQRPKSLPAFLSAIPRRRPGARPRPRSSAARFPLRDAHHRFPASG